MTAQWQNSDELGGKVALVTGAGSGIGAAIAAELVRAGALVAVVDLDPAAAEGTAARLGRSALAVQADVRTESGARQMVASAVRAFGRLDVAVNNAGITLGATTSTCDTTLEDWRRVMAVNLDGMFLCLREQIGAMRAVGGGSVVNIASVLGLNAQAGASAYVASKHAVIGLTKVAAMEYAAEGIRVNAVAPGVIDTAMMAAKSAPERAEIVGRHALGRLGAPEEIAAMVRFLASPASSFVTGSVHLVDGGYSAV